MEPNQLLLDAFGRVREVVHAVLEGLGPDELAYRPAEDANSIGWLVWHLTRIQDDHVAAVAGTEQIWTSGGWHQRFEFGFEAEATGYGHRPDEVARVRFESFEPLQTYFDAVHERTTAFLTTVQPADLDRIVDRRFDPPVTLGVRLVSVIGDDLQHAGQAAFLRGLLG